MKEKYESPEMEIISIDIEDIFLTSGCRGDGEEWFEPSIPDGS